ncbi:MAG: hypothetical protein N4J56_007407 [Chroococcidiopsis sp. SAG 2025]|uniref:hypothetical protein n=1 Tax=Chroococcidiopsis sp. SAG 2025 TaxID=171389 RepID=UPI002936E199|nr:hypothetical protein [Chroococcidiopsis sp. SAG 2025]MDV2997702.1 hypothetical protein [Chroococcidiopsis sp. SAG 2025]
MNSSSKKPSYTGKNVFIGIDVHKLTGRHAPRQVFFSRLDLCNRYWDFFIF